MKNKRNIVVEDEAKTLKAVKRAAVGVFIGFFAELALLIFFAFGCVDTERIKQLLQDTLGLVAFVLGMISVGVGGVIMLVVQIKTFIRGLSVKEGKEHLTAAAYWTAMTEGCVGLFIFFIVYMLGVSVVSSGGLYATGVWVAFFACAFLVYAANAAFWKTVYGNGLKIADWIELCYALLRFAVVLAITVLAANVNAAQEVERAWSLHDNLLKAYGLLETVQYVLKAVFAVGSLALLFYLFGNEDNEVDGRKVLRKYTWAVAILTVVDCALYIINALAVSTVWSAIGGWLACARKFWIPIVLMVIALHVSHLFPKGTEVYGDFRGILKKKDIQRVEERIEKVRAEDTTPQE